MGTLLSLDDGTSIPLRTRTRIGRAADSTWRLTHASTSRDHCTLTWDGDHWELRDLGSANGTFLDGRRIPAGTPVRLERGAVLGFGAAAGSARLEDASPPQPAATRSDGETREGQSDVLDLFCGDVAVTVWHDGARWRCEGAFDRTVNDGDVLELAGQTWTLSLPSTRFIDPTVADREAHATPAIRLEIGSWHPAARQVRTPAGDITLSPTEARLLDYLIERRGEPVSHRELLARVWGYRDGLESRTLYVTVGRLRQKIEREPSVPRHLLAVPGVGYRFVG